MSIEETSEQALYDAIHTLAGALYAVKQLPRPKEVARIMKTAKEYAAMAGIILPASHTSDHVSQS